MTGTIYLIHFERRLKHAGHYIGWTENLEGRVEAHRTGRGSRLLAIVSDQGIGFRVVRTWRGSRTDERRLKRRKNSPQLCPECKNNNMVTT